MAAGARETTNNRMEVAALIGSLVWLRENAARGDDAVLRFDSEYAIRGAFQWMANWKANGWRGAGKKPVSNVDLWERVDREMSAVLEKGVTLEPAWVRGHTNDRDNELADKVAGMMSKRWKDNPEAAAAAGVLRAPAEDYETPPAGSPDVRLGSIREADKAGQPVLMMFGPDVGEWSGQAVVVRHQEGEWRLCGPQAPGWPDEAFSGKIRSIADIARIEPAAVAGDSSPAP